MNTSYNSTENDPRALYPLSDDLFSSHRETIVRLVGLDIKHTKTYPLGKVQWSAVFFIFMCKLSI